MRNTDRAIKRCTAVLLTVASLFASCAVPREAAAASSQPNIVLILTDDQRFDTTWAMPIVQSELVNRGIEFTNGFVSNALCCPSRASILTGMYSHSNGLYTNRNRERFGGFRHFDDRSTVATWLQADGYRTALIGKYFNGYTGTYVPPGWDRWFATRKGGGYYDYLASVDGDEFAFGSEPGDYGTTVLAQEARDFITSTDADQPFFLYFGPHAPHNPATPAPGDRDAFSDLGRWRPESHDERGIGDKPEYIRDQQRLSRSDSARIDEFRVDQYRSLLSVDRAVGVILDSLRDTGRLANTVIVFISDNGMLWGEHRWHKKVVPYEESIRVPFVIRADGLISEARRDQHLVLNIDLAPTFADLAGVAARGVDGRSLVPLLSSPDGPWRADFLLEHMRKSGGGVPTYCGVHSRRYVYIDYVTGEQELYDLRRDPYELRNVVDRAHYRDARRSLQGRLRHLCDPLPPGFRLSFSE